MSGTAGGRAPRRLAAIGAAAVLLLALAVTAAVWLIVGRSDADASITEPTALGAVDGFVHAYNARDSGDVSARACPARRTLVLAAVDANRRDVRSMRRVGNPDVTRDQAFVTAQLATRRVTGNPNGSTVMSVAKNASGRWCVSSLAGAFRSGPLR